MSKRHICKSKFHVCYHFLRNLWKAWEKNFINPSCPKHPKIFNWSKKWHRFSESFHLFETPKRCVKIKKLCYFPPSSIAMRSIKTVFCQTPDLCHFHFLDNRTPSELLTNSAINNTFLEVVIKQSWYF